MNTLQSVIMGVNMFPENQTGYPSVDMPWLKYYTEEAKNIDLQACSMYEYIYRNNKEHLDDIALVFFNRRITYRFFFENINKTARAFSAIGVKKGDTVTLCMLNSPELVYILYSLNMLGAVTCVVNVLSSETELNHYVDEVNSNTIVTDDLFFEKCSKVACKKDIKNLIWVSLFESLNIQKRALYRLKVKKPNSKVSDKIISWKRFIKFGTRGISVTPSFEKGTCAVIGHTGGTTGIPKGVMLTSESFNIVAAQIALMFAPHRQESCIDTIVPFAIYGLMVDIHLPLSVGMKVILIPKVDPQSFDKLLMKYRPNYIPSIPLYWAPIISSERIRDLSFIKWASSGGSGFSQEQIDRLNQVLKSHNANAGLMMGYGLSESCALACVQTKGNDEPESVGSPLPLNVISAFDPEDGAEKKYGEIGELCICGPSLMIGYVNNVRETESAIRIHKDGQKWLHTGDLGYISDSGSVYIIGRMKRVYITQKDGAVSKIYPDRIENMLIQHSAIDKSCVICVKDDEDINKAVFFGVLKAEYKDNSETIRAELEEKCKKDLPAYAWPVRYLFIDDIPMTPVGKTDYQALENMLKE